MTSSLPNGLRVTAWTATTLLAMAAAAGTADAVASHHGGGGYDGPSHHAMPEFLHSVSTFKVNKHVETVKRQTGRIEDVNSEAIVVTSPDEYAATYLLGKHTRVMKDCHDGSAGKLSDGDKVSVLAKKVHGKFRAELISDGHSHHGHDGYGHDVR
jgi:hypothetical protein